MFVFYMWEGDTLLYFPECVWRSGSHLCVKQENVVHMKVFVKGSRVQQPDFHIKLLNVHKSLINLSVLLYMCNVCLYKPGTLR